MRSNVADPVGQLTMRAISLALSPFAEPVDAGRELVGLAAGDRELLVSALRDIERQRHPGSRAGDRAVDFLDRAIRMTRIHAVA